MTDIRPISTADIELICTHRRAMFADAGKDAEALAAMEAPFRSWLADRLAAERYFGFFALDGGRVIGGVGLMIIDWPPHPAHPGQGHRGYFLNVYVEPEYRGQGVARALMQSGETELSRRGASYAVLHATDRGRPLYEATGWEATSEMAKLI